MDHANARPLQRNGQSSEKIHNHFPNGIVRQNLRHELAVLRVKLLTEIPGIIELSMAQQNIEIMIAKHALSPPHVDEPLNQSNDRRTIRPAIRQIADKHKPPPFSMRSIFVVTEMPHEERKHLDFAMHIADDIDRAVEECLNE
jgi:hypothetical protein